MYTHDVTRDALITTPFVVVPDNKDHIETRQNCCLEINVLAGRFQFVVAAENRVSGGQNRRSRVENRGDTSFGDRNGLLFHSFVDSDSVFVSHFVELINTHDTSVGQNHGTSFQVEFAGCCVSLHGCSQTSRRRTFTRRIDGNGRYFFRELEKLGLCSTGVSEKQDVNVSTQFHAVRKNFLRATHEQTHNGLFDVQVSVDGRRNAASKSIVQIRPPADL